MPGELAALFRSLADDTDQAAGSMARAISWFTTATADTEDANVARTLAADADTARAIQAIQADTGGWTGAGHVEASSPEAEAAYTSIRANADDVARIAANTGINEEVLAQAKAHLFMTEHDVPVGPGQIARGYFTANETTAQLWDKATMGTLSDDDLNEFRSLMSHEYVESRLMARGMPYRSADPAAWDGPDQIYSTRYFGAHEVAPKSSSGSMSHWDGLGLRPPANPIAPDLSNLDDVVNAARKGLKL
jgi:hypothetical protein